MSAIDLFYLSINISKILLLFLEISLDVYKRQEMHGPAIQAAIISIYSMVGIFGKIVLGWLNDRFGVVVSTVCGCVAFAVSFIFMLMGSNVTMLYIMAVLFGLGDAIGTVTPPLVTAAVFGTKKYGQAYGIARCV